MLSSDYSKRESFAVSKLKEVIPREFKANALKQSKGFFVELFENNQVFPEFYMASAVDGVGSKAIIASLMNKFDSIGIDLVAMNANDIATLPLTKPFLFLDYIAAQHKILELGLTKELMKGIIKGLKQANLKGIIRKGFQLNLGKGETASMDEVIACPRKGYGFDLAASMIGFIEKKHARIKLEDKMQIIALKSNGLHSNGFTLARHLLLNGSFEKRKEFKNLYKGKFSLNYELPFRNATLGEELLKPTIIYSQLLARLARKLPYVFGVNNTGFGLHNFNRLKGSFDFIINNPLKPDPLFEFIKENSRLSWKEMYQKFNMSQGFFVFVRKKDLNTAFSILEKEKVKAKLVGFTRKSKKNRVILSADFIGRKLVFEGY